MRLRVRPHTFQAAPSHPWASVEKCYWSRAKGQLGPWASGCSPAPLCLVPAVLHALPQNLSCNASISFYQSLEMFTFKVQCRHRNPLVMLYAQQLVCSGFLLGFHLSVHDEEISGLPTLCLPPLGRAILRMQISALLLKTWVWTTQKNVHLWLLYWSFVLWSS